MSKSVLFIHGAGEGAFEADKKLAESLQNSLGPAYDVRYPRMPEDDSSAYADWKAPIERELARLDGEISLVGHSVGGSVLLKYLAATPPATPVAALFLLAAPFWGADEFWTWDDGLLPEDAAAKLADIPRVFLYHSRDDEVVPFAHLALYAAKLPQATVRALDGRGHQFGDDLSEVAEAIRRPAPIAGE
ncbi:MAG TPA: alpha/beta fold hydrolase [Herpetosiphonaceae bacterium]